MRARAPAADSSSETQFLAVKSPPMDERITNNRFLQNQKKRKQNCSTFTVLLVNSELKTGTLKKIVKVVKTFVEQLVETWNRQVCWFGISGHLKKKNTCANKQAVNRKTEKFSNLKKTKFFFFWKSEAKLFYTCRSKNKAEEMLHSLTSSNIILKMNQSAELDSKFTWKKDGLIFRASRKKTWRKLSKNQWKDCTNCLK